MATQEDVRRIALSLPETSEADDHFGFSVLNKGKPKGFVWAWNERIPPKKPRVPRPFRPSQPASGHKEAVTVARTPHKEASLGPAQLLQLVRFSALVCLRGRPHRREAVPARRRSIRISTTPGADGVVVIGPSRLSRRRTAVFDLRHRAVRP